MTIRELMQRNDLTVEDVAEIGGVTHRSVRSWLSGATKTPMSVLLILTAIDEGVIGIYWIAFGLSKISEKKGA